MYMKTKTERFRKKDPKKKVSNCSTSNTGRSGTGKRSKKGTHSSSAGAF